MLTLLRHKCFIEWSMTSKVTKGCIRSSWNFKIVFFCNISFVLHPTFLKLFKNVNIRRHIFFIKWSMTSKVIQDHFYAKIKIAHSFMDQFWSKFVWMLISWRHNFSYMTWNVMHFNIIEKFFNIFTKTSDLITTLTYFLMDNFCPCIYVLLIFSNLKKLFLL